MYMTRGKRERNRLVFERLSRNECSGAAIGREEGITRQRVSEIFLKEKSRAEHPKDALASLDIHSRRILRRVLRMDSITIADLKRFVEGNRDWEEQIFFTPRCGELRLERIKSLMRDNGVI